MKWRIILILGVLAFIILFFGCGGGGPSVSPGIYKYSIRVYIDGEKYLLMFRMRFNEEGTYLILFSSRGTNVYQERGNWKMAGDSISFTNVESNELYEDGNWSSWQPDTDIMNRVRNITEESFDFYMVPSYEREKANLEDYDLEEGWYTFTRTI